MSADAAARRPSPVAVLRHRDYLLLWLGLLVSNTGSWMQFVALGFLVDRLTHSPMYLGLLALVQAVPRITFSLIGGAVADRVERRAVLLWTNVFLMVSAGTLTVLTLTGRVAIWHVLVLAALNALVSAFDAPARQSLMPSLVREDEMLQAITLNSFAFNGSGIWGPSIGGVVIALAGEAGAFGINTVSYVATIAALLLMRTPRHQPAGNTRFSEDLRESLAMLRRQPRLLVVLAVAAAVSFFGRPYIRLMPALARATLHVDARGLGLLQAAPGVGTLLSVLLMGPLRGQGGLGRFLARLTLAFGVAVVIFSLSGSFAVSVVMLVVVGTFQALILSSANTLLQTSVPVEARGRVMGVFAIVTFGMLTLGTVPVSALAEVTGVPVALALGGLAVILCALAARRALGAMR